MAAFPVNHYFFCKSSPIQESSKGCARIHLSLSCHGRSDSTETDTPRPKKDKIEQKHFVSELLDRVEKLGKTAKKNLSPQQKGDWKDLVLMSLSFAVYVYISQKIVCTYYVWTSMPKQPW